MRAPWLTSGQQRVDGSVGHIDLVPTILDLLGESQPDHLEGKSLVPVLRGEETLDDNDVFIEWNGISPDTRDRFLGSDAINRMLAMPYRSVVSDRWKLNLCAGDQGELFDLRSDPHEQTNLFRRSGPSRPHPRHGGSHPHVAARDGGHGGAAGGLNNL